MKIINIFERSEYMFGLKLILLNIIAFIAFSDCVKEIYLKKLFLFILGILLFYYLYCIFIESEFDSYSLKATQIIFEKYLYLASIILTIAISINSLLFILFPLYYVNYKDSFPFIINNFDYALHFEKRCELYKINNDNFLPYQYICSYNPEKIDSAFEAFKMNKYFSYIKCSQDESLMKNNNNIINSFINEYAKNEIYFCNLKELPKKFNKINPKDANFSRTFCPELLTIMHFYLVVKYLVLVNIYFKNIKANVNCTIIIYGF